MLNSHRLTFTNSHTRSPNLQEYFIAAVVRRNVAVILAQYSRKFKTACGELIHNFSSFLPPPPHLPGENIVLEEIFFLLFIPLALNIRKVHFSHKLKHVKYAARYQVVHSLWRAVLDQDLLLLVQTGDQVQLEKLCGMEAFNLRVGCPSPWLPHTHSHTLIKHSHM